MATNQKHNHPPIPTVTKEMYEDALNKLVRLAFCSDKLLVLTEESDQLTNQMLVSQAKAHATVVLWNIQHSHGANNHV